MAWQTGGILIGSWEMGGFWYVKIRVVIIDAQRENGMSKGIDVRKWLYDGNKWFTNCWE